MASADEIQLVLNRIQNMPSNLKLVIGNGYSPLTKQQLIEHVKNNDEVGELIISAHMLYLRSFKEKNRFG